MSGHPPVLPYRAEVQRKALHLLALVLPVGIVLLGRPGALYGLVPLALLAVAMDVGRQRVPAFRAWIERHFAFMMRPEEQPAPDAPLVFNGAVWMCVSAALCALLFPPVLAAAALAMLMTGDGAAALVGRRYGRTRYPWSPKSLEGSLAFAGTAFLTGLPLALLFPAQLPLGVCALGAVVAAALEALPIPTNDNVRVPVLTAAAMWGALALLG